MMLILQHNFKVDKSENNHNSQDELIISYLMYLIYTFQNEYSLYVPVNDRM